LSEEISKKDFLLPVQNSKRIRDHSVERVGYGICLRSFFAFLLDNYWPNFFEQEQFGCKKMVLFVFFKLIIKIFFKFKIKF
jgi:hypothetical protein